MEIDVLMKATYIVGFSFVTTAFIYWWCWFTVEKVHIRVLSFILFFTPIITILVVVSYLVLVNI